jgi:hypothetical protein
MICKCSLLNFLKYVENFIFFFISVSALLPVYLKISNSTSVCFLVLVCIFVCLFVWTSFCLTIVTLIAMQPLITILNFLYLSLSFYLSIPSSLPLFSFFHHLFPFFQVSSSFFTFLRLSFFVLRRSSSFFGVLRTWPCLAFRISSPLKVLLAFATLFI